MTLLLGISPFAAGAPSNNEIPYILDMAPSVVAKGKTRRAVRRGEDIPLGWALDKEGNPTTDASVSLEGSMTPIGGPKSSGIAIFMDIMSDVLSGAAFGGESGQLVQGQEATKCWPLLHGHQSRRLYERRSVPRENGRPRPNA